MTSRIRFQDCFKRYRLDQDRVRPPSDTAAWARSRLESTGLDLLRSTERVDRRRLGIPVYVSRCGTDALRLLGKPVQMGKGATVEQAEASALMELVERLSLARFASPVAALTRLEDLEGPCLGIEQLAASVSDDGADIERLEPLFRIMPMRWVWARNLTAGRDERIPFDWFHRIHESNGAATGNTLEEAALQGVCELVERHLASIVTHEQRETPWIRNGSLQDPVARELAGKMTGAGIKLYLKDFSLDIGVPTVGLVAYAPETFPEKSELVFTAGTATSPHKAAIRAITEAAQLAGDFLSKTRYQPTLPRYESLEQARYLLDTTTRVSILSLPDISNDNIRAELETVVAALSRSGLTLYAVNITDELLDVPAVFMVVPGAHLQERTRKDGLLFHFARLASLAPEPAQAIALTRRYLETFPGRFETLFFAGYALERAGMARQALTLFRQALAANPDPDHLTSIHAHIGVCLKDLGDLDGAIRALTAATSLVNAQKESFQVLGQCYYMRKAYYRAIDAFGQAIQRDANSAIDHANMAACLRELGHRAEAIRLYEIALRLDPLLHAARVHLERLSRGE